MLRHDLLILTKREQRRVISDSLWQAAEQRFGFLADGKGGEVFNLPGIVKRQEPLKSGVWQAGFSFPWFENGIRVRLAAEVRSGEIVKKITPFDAAVRLKDGKGLQEGVTLRRREGRPWQEKNYFALKELCDLAVSHGLRLGVYGSTALEAVTGYLYLHGSSDLDVIVEADSFEKAEQFSRAAGEDARRMGVKLDMEVRLSFLGDVKAEELLSGQRTIIVREIDSIFLFDRKRMIKL